MSTEVRRAAVIGAGQMGREIALVLALAGIDTALYDIDPDMLLDAERHNSRLLEKRYDTAVRARAEHLVTYQTGLADAVGESDLIIEAVTEDPAIKADVLAELDRLAKPGAIIASNTSSIPITRLAENVAPSRRERFVGLHFSSPATRMPFLEIIPGADSDPSMVEDMAVLGGRLGKQVILSKDVPGFVANRLLLALMAEAQRLEAEGVASVEHIDAACRYALGHPMGPFQIMDMASNDLMLRIQRLLHETYGERFQPSENFLAKVAAGELGWKTGKGWYDYEKG